MRELLKKVNQTNWNSFFRFYSWWNNTVTTLKYNNKGKRYRKSEIVKREERKPTPNIRTENIVGSLNKTKKNHVKIGSFL